ncbi:MAG: amidotransferase [Chitinophagaceae bacterium]|nr:amidotransferase [Chitinophagaceae bacterium]
MNKTRIHIFQHVPYEGPGSIADWLSAQGYEYSIIRLYEKGYTFPALEEMDALIVLGGPMGVYDEWDHPWLYREKAFIEDCMDAGKKVLGICLGAQLIACCLGARVCTATQKEIGWYPVVPTPECSTVPWLQELFREQPFVFHWHGDQFDIPYDESIHVLSSQANKRQAFVKGEQVIALQFHAELTEDWLAGMLEQGRQELKAAPYIQAQADIEAGSRHIDSCRQLMDTILQHWLHPDTCA